LKLGSPGATDHVLKIDLPLAADLVFSVGLIEHFDEEGTRRAVDAHFALLKPGGIAVISFPTPTPLYRLARAAAELAGAWIFHDERPLRLAEVAAAAGPHAEMLSHRILWPIVFTQCLGVWRKHGPGDCPDFRGASGAGL
jgi:cyclopropane fatty-acyl-phospholipid synthase-like methyltransferase